MGKKSLTTPEFIVMAKAVHGDTYDYSKSVYKKAKEKIIVVCRTHGEFIVLPDNHLRKAKGCGKCSGRYMDTEYFKEKAQQVHGDKYDYSKVKYQHNAKKILIICPEHGEFMQTPNSHLSNGTGCPECGKILIGDSKRFSANDFIEKARELHDNKYDYSKVEYVNMHEKVIIICPEHGEFLQEASAHLSGQGCPECGRIQRPLSRRNTREEWIEKARAVHGDRYDYSKVDYITVHDKIVIICPEHGEFIQDPSNHLVGAECPQCAHRSFKYTTPEWIEKAREVHGDKYDYSKVEYVDSKTKIVIICPEHGEFLQTPSSHLVGTGCARCYGRGFNYMSFEEARKIIQPLNFTSREQYYNWWDDNRKYCQQIGLPKDPYTFYLKHQ